MEGGCPEQRYLTVAVAGGICYQICLKKSTLNVRGKLLQLSLLIHSCIILIIFFISDKKSVNEVISSTDVFGHLSRLEVLELISLANRHASHITKAWLLNVGFVLVKLKTTFRRRIRCDGYWYENWRTLCPLTCRKVNCRSHWFTSGELIGHNPVLIIMS
jgi:hypothetical protein